jgi:hypothetical protein
LGFIEAFANFVKLGPVFETCFSFAEHKDGAAGREAAQPVDRGISGDLLCQGPIQ